MKWVLAIVFLIIGFVVAKATESYAHGPFMCCFPHAFGNAMVGGACVVIAFGVAPKE